MKTTIDSKQAERLKEVCEKHGVKLPVDIGFHKYDPPEIDDVCGIRKLGEDKSSRIAGSQHMVNLTELLDWLPKRIYGDINLYVLDVMYGANDWYSSYYCVSVAGTKYLKEQTSHSDELIDALFELFIWTIENRYYKGVE